MHHYLKSAKRPAIGKIFKKAIAFEISLQRVASKSATLLQVKSGVGDNDFA
jgi:hypothetical protein